MWGLSRCPGTQGPWDLPGSCCIWEAHPIRPRLQDPWEAAWVLVGTPAREPTAHASEVVLGKSALLAGMRGWGQCGSFQVPGEGGQSYHSAWAGPAGFSCPVLTRPPCPCLHCLSLGSTLPAVGPGETLSLVVSTG